MRKVTFWPNKPRKDYLHPLLATTTTFLLCFLLVASSGYPAFASQAEATHLTSSPPKPVVNALLRDGDARQFADRPDVIAYANTQAAEAGLVAYYSFDGNTRDYSGKGNDGTPKGSLTYTSGVVGQGARFDGKSHIEVNDSASLDLYNALTMAAWVYKDDAGTGGWAIILSKGDTAALDEPRKIGG